jgi:hypothetical protein
MYSIFVRPRKSRKPRGKSPANHKCTKPTPRLAPRHTRRKTASKKMLVGPPSGKRGTSEEQQPHPKSPTAGRGGAIEFFLWSWRGAHYPTTHTCLLLWRMRDDCHTTYSPCRLLVCCPIPCSSVSPVRRSLWWRSIAPYYYVSSDLSVPFNAAAAQRCCTLNAHTHTHTLPLLAEQRSAFVLTSRLGNCLSAVGSFG